MAKKVKYTQPLLGEVNAAGYLILVPGAVVQILQDGDAVTVYSDEDGTEIDTPALPSGVASGTAGVSTRGELTVWLEPGSGYSGVSTVGQQATTFPIPDISPDIEDVTAAAATRASNAQTVDYVLVLADAGKAIDVNSASARNVTMPLHSSVAFPIGTLIEVAQKGAGQVTIVPAGGVTLSGSTTTPAQNGSVYLRKTATNSWHSVSAAPSGTYVPTVVPNPTLDTNAANRRYVDIARRRTATAPAKIVTLVGGQDDETAGAVCAAGTLSVDTVNYKVGDRGWKCAAAGAATMQFILDSSARALPPVAAIGLWIYVADASKVTSIEVSVYSGASQWEKVDATMVTGWNFRRWPSIDGTLAGLAGVTRCRIIANTSAATYVTIGHLWAECPPKAQIMVVADGPEASFYTEAYPALKALGVPVSFALAPNLLGTGSKMSLAQVATVAAENDNSIGFHSWASEVTSSMTAAQLRSDTMKCIKWLEDHGYHDGHLWRMAWTQNSAPNHAAIRELVLAYSSAVDNSGTPVTCWPPGDRWNIPRYSLHGRTTSAIDTAFTQLQSTHGLMNCYTHGINAAGGTDMTPAEFSYFLGKVTAGVAAGWLEGVTFEQLYGDAGGKVRRTLGDYSTEFYGADGVLQSKRLP